MNYDYFFTKESDVLIVDEDAGEVEVRDTFQTSNVSTNILNVYNSNYDSNVSLPSTSQWFQNTLYINNCNLRLPLPVASNVVNGIDWNVRNRTYAPIHHTWIQYEPSLSNAIWIDKWAGFGGLAGAFAGGALAAVQVSSIYSAPFTSPSGTKAFDKATEIAGSSAGDDAIALGISVGREWGIYSAGLEGGKDGETAGRHAVSQLLKDGIDNEEDDLEGDTEEEAGAIGAAAGTAAAFLGGNLPAWLGAGWFMKGKAFGEKLGKLVTIVVYLVVISYFKPTMVLDFKR